MKILVTNEAGCFHPGVVALAKELAKNHRVCIIGPLRGETGSGHALTTSEKPLRARQWFVLNSVKMWSVDGTACDCVGLGLDKLLKTKPDLIISGIDYALNRGNMIYSSGVVSASLEGAIQGIKSIAVSAEIKDPDNENDYRAVARYVSNNLEKLVKMIPDYGALNLNFPAKFSAKNFKLTKLTDGLLDNEYVLEVNPFGDTFAWLKSPLREFGLEAYEQQGDLYWLRQGYITATPLQLDLLKADAVPILQKAGIRL